MKKVWMLWMTFIVAVILGVLAAQVPCWESCPRDYSDDGAKCQDCCDVRCPNNIAKTRCKNNCPP
ncbi:hypothetical protein Q2T83_14595 [Fervidibacter sacchari]|uniref:4Fe-4S ferredoxin-type domain-containing protein n=1 Tax=Candidatus Fervidibacter sacchari TaxID=1448929 RepID=A0ABT2EIE0_9BACT|nr:hypothetical protein [Candidatus Fervidibacter sacchari]MCS3917723.1 hypothetical protein [Candidatus Fervidibacter sacchari]WKU15550.1 hypothetical protein Q2T83_14595 [Candidatus Fervidibacter sacchari]